MLRLESAILRRFYADWDVRRRGREFPARRDFDPCDLAYALGYVSLMDVLRDPLRFRFRLHATGIAERTGAELTGKFVHEMKDLRHRDMAAAHFREVVETRRPVANIRRAYVTDRRIWNCEVLVAPLSSNGSDIDMLISCIAWDEARPPGLERAGAGSEAVP
ncbi:MAG: PAS domain-containing protein [Alphaproteobacteria bacterium]|nr:PAS domain-containing protein [Alphaproteobacteria bacterium]